MGDESLFACFLMRDGPEQFGADAVPSFTTFHRKDGRWRCAPPQNLRTIVNARTMGAEQLGRRAIAQQMIAARFNPDYLTKRIGLHQGATRRLRAPGPAALQARPLRNDRRADDGLACEDGGDETRLLEGTVAPDPRRTREGRAAPSRRLLPELLSASRSRRSPCPEAALPGSGEDLPGGTLSLPDRRGTAEGKRRNRFPASDPPQIAILSDQRRREALRGHHPRVDPASASRS